ncbi:hypothetical protein Tco_0676512 [Tanacetum coccineum]
MSLMKRTSPSIKEKPAACDSKKANSNNRVTEQSRRQDPMNQSSRSRTTLYRGHSVWLGERQVRPTNNDPKAILATEGANFPKPPANAHSEEQRVLNHRLRTTSEGKDKQRSGRHRKNAPRDKATPSIFSPLTADNAVVEPLTIDIMHSGCLQPGYGPKERCKAGGFAWTSLTLTKLPPDCYPLPGDRLERESLCGYPFNCLSWTQYKGIHVIEPDVIQAFQKKQKAVPPTSHLHRARDERSPVVRIRKLAGFEQVPIQVKHRQVTPHVPNAQSYEEGDFRWTTAAE